MRLLERAIGTQLLTRTSRHVELTPSGVVLLQDARRALELAERGVVNARRASRGETGYLRIGFRESAAVALLPAILRSFRQSHPGVSTILDELDDHAQVTEINDARMHIGFIRAKPNAPNVESEVILKEPYGAILPSDHPLALKNRIPLSALAGERFILWPRGPGDQAYDDLLAACRRHGFTPNVIQETLNAHTIMGMVSAGIGVSLLAYSYRHMSRPGIRVVPIQGMTTELRLAWVRPMTSPLVQQFRQLAHKTVVEREPKYGVSASLLTLRHPPLEVFPSASNFNG